MFDANMTHLPNGKEFFGKIHYLSANKDDALTKLGYKTGDLVQCVMLGEDNKNPKVKIVMAVGESTMTPNTTEDCWIVYEGDWDGSGFIDDDSKEKAAKILINKSVWPYKPRL